MGDLVSEPTHTHQEAEDAAVTALLRMTERLGIDRQVLADMTPQEQAAVFAAEARVQGRRK